MAEGERVWEWQTEYPYPAPDGWRSAAFEEARRVLGRTLVEVLTKHDEFRRSEWRVKVEGPWSMLDVNDMGQYKHCLLGERVVVVGARIRATRLG